MLLFLARRLADHFVGKSHVAFLAIRKKLSKLQQMNLSASVLFRVFSCLENRKNLLLVLLTQLIEKKAKNRIEKLVILEVIITTPIETIIIVAVTVTNVVASAIEAEAEAEIGIEIEIETETEIEIETETETETEIEEKIVGRSETTVENEVEVVVIIVLIGMFVNKLKTLGILDGFPHSVGCSLELYARERCPPVIADSRL